ncbi:MAG: cupin domain-containing protein [Chloroflexi bacterium]|nr:cupin domain-containing protein [Chloroflexota bacterium]
MKAVAWKSVPEDRLIQGIRRQIVTGEKVMLGRIRFPKGAKVLAHRHVSEQITHVLAGALAFVMEGKERVVVRAGETLTIPSNMEHSAEALEETDEIDAFGPIRTDWLHGSDAYMREPAPSR